MSTILLQQQAKTYSAISSSELASPPTQTLNQLSQPAVAVVLKAQAGQSYRLVDNVSGKLVIAKSIQRDGRRVIVELENDNSVEIDDFFTSEGEPSAALELVTGTTDALCPVVVTPSSVKDTEPSDTAVVLWRADQASDLCPAPLAATAAMIEGTAAATAATTAATAASAGVTAGAAVGAAGAGLSSGWLAAAGLGLAAAAGGGGGNSSTPTDPKAQALQQIQASAQNNTANGNSPSLATYTAAGVTGVNAENLSVINNALNTSPVDGAHADTTAKVQALVDSVNRILSEANGSAPDASTTNPSAADYAGVGANIGSAATDPENLALLNSIVGGKTASDVSTASQINALAQIANNVQSTAAGDTSAPALTVADLNAIGLIGVNADNLAAIQKAIASQPNDGSGTVSLTQLQAIVQSVNDAQASIVTAAQGNTASVSTLPLSTYETAGVTGVTADNQAAIQTALNSSQVQGADVNTSAKVQSLVDAYTRILAEANGPVADATPAADPSSADYTLIGVTGVNSDVKAALLGDVIGDKVTTDVDTVAQVQTLADAVSAVMTATAAVTPTGPSLAQLQALGLTGVTADNLASVQKAIASTADDGSGADSVAELQSLVSGVNNAINAISAAAQANNATTTTPTATTYAIAGVTGVTSGNLAAVNDALNSASVIGTSVDTATEIQTLVNSYSAILAEANGSAADATPADPSATDYANIGVTGVNTAAQVSLLGDAIGEKVSTDVDTVAEVQALANAVSSVMNAASANTPTGPSLAELQALGIVGVTSGTLSAVQQAIANTSDDGTGVDTLAELQAVVDGVIAPVSAISNAAQNNSATATSPSVNTYVNAGVTGVTSGNLAAINSALNSSAVVGSSVDTTSEIQTLVNSYSAILAEANGATPDATPADPSATDYANIGVTGVNTAAKVALLGDVIGEKVSTDVDTVAEVQALANAVSSVMTAAASATPTGPSLAELQALGLTGVTADNLSAVQKAISGTADDGTGADSLAELQALVNGVNNAINTISSAAQANNATATSPSTATYATAGVSGVTSGNLAAVNDALNSSAVVGSSVDTTSEIQTLVNSYSAILAEANGATPDATPADPSATDYANIGVTGVNTAAQVSLLGDAIGEKVSTDVDTVAEVQALANAVSSVMTAAAAATPTGPSLAELQTLGLTGVTADNLSAVQKAISGTADDGTGADSLAELQALVNGVNNAINTISSAAQANNATATSPSTATYATAGVSGVTSGNLSAVNDALNSASVIGTSVDTAAEIQTLVNSYSAILAEANGATPDATPADPSATDYANIGANIGTAATDSENLALLNDILGDKVASDVDTISEINALAVIANAIELTAAGGTPSPALTVADLQKAGLANVTTSNLANVLAGIAAKNDNGSETDSLAELQAIVNTAAPTTTVSTLSLSQDSGLSNSDFITKDASQTVSGTLSANTAAGEKVQISLDNGSTWVDATNTVGTNTFSLATNLTASNTLQARVVDARNNAAPVHNQSYTFDTTAPTSAVDLDSASGTQASSSQTVNSGDWQSGVQIAANVQAPTSTDIHALKITLGGAGLVGTDHLLLDSTDVVLGANSTGSNLTIGGVSGLSYTYNSTTHVLTLSQASNAAFDPSKVDDILQTLQMHSTNMAEATPGERTVTLAYEDLAGNDSNSATSTFNVIPVAQMSTVNLIQSQLATQTTGSETVTAYNNSGSFYFERNIYNNWNAQNTWAQSKTYDAADGSTQQMHLVHVNTSAESTALRQTPSNTTRNDTFFMGETDWNKDGVWEYSYSGNSQASQVSQAFFQKNNATDTTPWGNYTQWNTGEPGTDPVETISAVSSGGGWIDWSPSNNADGMAELEYSRVLNLAKTSNLGSIDVASSTAGTAYLVKSTATVTDVASITGLADSQWNSVSVGSSGIQSYEDFSRTPKGWSQGANAISSGLSLGSNLGLNGTLGRFGNTTEGTQEVSKTYTGLPANTKVWIEFDMLELDNWQGQSFNVYVNNTLTVATQYFGTGNVKDAWDGGLDLGNVSDGSNGGNANSSLREEAHRYAIQATTDANGQIKLGFGMSTSSSDTNVLATSEASWSIDNMTIRSTSGSASSSLSLAGLENGTYVLYTADANGNLSRNATTTVKVEPGTTVKTLSFSADTGASNTDFITKDANQTISGTLSANTTAGEKVQISLDNGNTWVDATNTVGTNNFSLITTLTASNTVQARIVDSANNVGTSLSQAYVLDTSAPAAVDLSANNGTQAISVHSVKSSTTTSTTVSIAPDIQAPTATDIITLSVTVGGAGLDTANDKLRLDGSTDRALSANFNASNVTVGGISGVNYSYDSSTRALTLSKNGGASFTAADVDNILSGISLRTTSTTEGARDFTIGYTDVAGNTSATATSTLTIDNTAPTVTASALSFSSDTGNSNSDRVTQTAAQTISGTLSASTDSGDTVQISMDAGSTWNNATHTAGSNTFSYASTLSGSNTAQVRVVDSAGNTGTANSYSYVIDNTAPTSAVDLSATAGTQATSAQTVNASDWASGVSIAPALQAPTSADITALKLTLGGAQLDNSNDQLQVGSNALTVGTSANGTNQTIGGVAGLNYSYDSSTHVLSITQTGNAAFDPTKIDDILQSLKLKSSSIDTATTGDRTATFAWTDLAGNEATSATASISVIPVAQASSLSLIQSQLTSSQNSAEKVTADSTQGSFYMDRNFAGNYWTDQQTWANSKSLSTATGSATMHLVHVNTSSENLALYELQNNNTTSTIKDNFFLGATDTNVDGVWDWQYANNVTQAFYNKNSIVTTVTGGANDTTPYGGYANWAIGEPTGGSETIAVYNMTNVVGATKTWFDWGNSNNNNADAIAELEYARVLNVAKTTTSALATQSLEVASSSAGTAYLVNSTVNVTDLNSITSAAGSKWNSVAVSNTILSYEDFNQTPTGWSLSGSATTSTVNLGSTNGLNSVLGRVANTQEGAQALSKTYALGLASTEVWVEFDMIEMDAWKGQNFNVFINNSLVNSAQYFGSDQTSLDAWDGGIDLGNLSTVNTNTALKEEAHHYALKATTDASGNLVLGFGMSGTWSSGNLVSINEASFGIDNVILRKTSSASLSLAGLEAGTYQLYTADSNGHLSQNYSTGLMIG